MKPPLPSRNNSKELLRYAGLGTQIMAALGIAVFGGIKADKWLHTFPLLACVLPLVVLSAVFYKLFRETSRSGKK
jgi:hypothetical protein